MDPVEKFRHEVAQNIAGLSADADLHALSRVWVREVTRHNWAYNFHWFGRPAIQFPNDIWAMQEIIWSVRPDIVIETGIAHGGSLVFSASMLALLDLCDATQAGEMLDPRAPKRRVLGVDIDIRAHNRSAIEAHPMASRIDLIEGSSVDAETVAKVQAAARGAERVLVCLDSNHTHEHVLAELQAYAPLVTPGSYCVVFDTIIENMPADMFPDRPWGPGNNAMTAVNAYLADHPEFEIDADMDAKLLISVAPRGYLKRTS